MVFYVLKVDRPVVEVRPCISHACKHLAQYSKCPLTSSIKIRLIYTPDCYSFPSHQRLVAVPVDWSHTKMLYGHLY